MNTTTVAGLQPAAGEVVEHPAFFGQPARVVQVDHVAHHAQVLAEPDPYQAIVLMTAHLTELWRRYAGIREVLRGAASTGEPALRDMWDTSQRQRLTAARSFIAALIGKGPLREGFDAGTAADIAWLLMDPDNYRALTVERGWSEAAYQRWLADTLSAALLPPRAP